ncbi:MAG: acyl carrier protein [Chitinophaga sp.]|uniref:acyl carrier protein n=1 Tax=Chitinophaga sp. TaxID=1869181 RepID=UPI0025B8DD14|nr:acyl carrier protein [Chitinophaga sp.]MBV8251523.1 acyl carrier protein [Chitinophaga sp.]
MKPIESTVINAISKSAGIPEEAISPDHSLNDLGMNSILAVQLLSNLQQQFGIKADLGGMSTSNTIGEIVDYFESNAK